MAVLWWAHRQLRFASATWPQGWVNPFDARITLYLNQFANRWTWLNPLLATLEEHNLLKGGPVILLLWVGFFQRVSSPMEALRRRRIIAACVPMALAAVILARVLAFTLPFRERPLRTLALHFQFPHGFSPNVLYGWSSFPSDHAALFIALGVGLFFASRLLGSLALLYTFIVILLPRVYLGFHWPTDLLAGAFIGIALGGFTGFRPYRNFVWSVAMKGWKASPGIFAAFVFLLSYEIVELFEAPVALAKVLFKHHL